MDRPRKDYFYSVLKNTIVELQLSWALWWFLIAWDRAFQWGTAVLDVVNCKYTVANAHKRPNCDMLENVYSKTGRNQCSTIFLSDFGDKVSKKLKLAVDLEGSLDFHLCNVIFFVRFILDSFLFYIGTLWAWVSSTVTWPLPLTWSGAFLRSFWLFRAAWTSRSSSSIPASTKASVNSVLVLWH